MKKKSIANKNKRKLDEIKIPGKLKEIYWVDATDDSGVNIKDIMKKDAIEFCVKRQTIGKVIKEDSTGIVIIKDMDENGDCDITTIPKRWTQ